MRVSKSLLWKADLEILKIVLEAIKYNGKTREIYDSLYAIVKNKLDNSYFLIY